MALAIIFTWVFNHTRGSIFFSNLLHASIDTPQVVWVPFFLVVDMTSLDLAALIGLGVPALLIIILTRGRLGYQPGEGRNGREQERLLVHAWEENPSEARHGQTEEHSFMG